ncbi:MAG: sodium:alanine symporter family protein, partial [Bacteroidales bacterium]|nr:sodium:alanine symporter family protein [Bacteroidales bacterium]
MTDFFELINQGLKWYNSNIGGWLVLAILLPTGIYFTIKLKFLQVTHIRHTISIVRGKYDKKGEHGDVNHFKALTTALSATVGTGNIVGVALAIFMGGPGAVFWMWMTAFFGMMLKMVECTLALKYRKTNTDGSVSGGPMYYMLALKEKIGKPAMILAVIFSIATVLCSLGTGNMAQANSMSDAIHQTYDIPTYLHFAGSTIPTVFITGAILAGLVLLVIVGGLKRIAEVTSKLVPIMAIFYFIAAITIIITFSGKIPAAFTLIFTDAFSGEAMAGGFIFMVFQGVRRGLFSNEAGQGSAPIAHAAAKTDIPLREGLVASLEPLVDTLIICTLTALVILLTGAWELGGEGAKMTMAAFTIGLDEVGIGNWGNHIVAVGLFLFAFSTVIAWSYYGTRAVQFLMGDKMIKPYYYIYGFFVFLGAVGSIDIVWNFVDAVITLMTFP